MTLRQRSWVSRAPGSGRGARTNAQATIQPAHRPTFFTFRARPGARTGWAGGAAMAPLSATERGCKQLRTDGRWE